MCCKRKKEKSRVPTPNKKEKNVNCQKNDSQMNQMPPSTKNDQNEIKLSPKSPTKKNENIPSNKPINPEVYQIKPTSENVDQQEKEKNSVIRQPQSPIPNKPAAPTIPNPEKKEISTKIDQNQNEKPPSEVKKVNELDATQENEIAKNQTPKEENKEKPREEHKSIKSKKQSRKDKLSEKKPQQEESEKFEEGDNNVSREDPSMDDTLKGVGTEMPHFES